MSAAEGADGEKKTWGKEVFRKNPFHNLDLLKPNSIVNSYEIRIEMHEISISVEKI